MFTSLPKAPPVAGRPTLRLASQHAVGQNGLHEDETRIPETAGRLRPDRGMGNRVGRFRNDRSTSESMRNSSRRTFLHQHHLLEYAKCPAREGVRSRGWKEKYSGARVWRGAGLRTLHRGLDRAGHAIRLYPGRFLGRTPRSGVGHRHGNGCGRTRRPDGRGNRRNPRRTESLPDTARKSGLHHIPELVFHRSTRPRLRAQRRRPIDSGARIRDRACR